jgi:uncharacterized membrane-anchored protein
MKKDLLPIITVLALLGLALPLSAQETNSVDPRVLLGPAEADLGGFAKVNVPAGHMFLDGNTIRQRMESVGEPTSGNEVGFLRPTNGGWSVYFEYADVGYVKDDEKDKLDAPELLKSLKKGNDAANEQRKRNGIPPLIIDGWQQEPKYDPATHNLTWCIRATVQGEPLLNYNTRLLGRKGFMSVTLVCEPDQLQSTLTDYNSLLAGYKFNTGDTYAEYKPGDKVAKYGLGALVLGGAAVGALKLGFFAWLLAFIKKGWKVVVIALVAIAAGAKKILNKITGNRPD